MSEDFAGNYAGIDSALDTAFAAIGEPVTTSDGAAVLPPAPVSSEGIWEIGKKEADDKKAAKAAKEKAAAKGKGVEKDDEGDDEKPLGKMDIKGRKKNAQNAGLDSSIDKALAKSADAQKERGESREAMAKGDKPRPLNVRSFNTKDVISSRRELRERFPNVKLSARMAEFEKWEESFRRDPAGTREAIMQAYLKVSPQNFSKSKGDDEKGKAKHQLLSLSDNLDSAFKGSDDLEDLKDYADKYGERLPHLLRQLNDIERDLIEDPVGTSARLAANYGALDAPKAPEQKPAAPQGPPKTPQEYHSRVSQGIQNYIEKGIMPALASEEVQEQVAFVLERMQRTGDHDADLKRAYDLVVPDAPRAAEPASTAGRKSISGAPSAAGSGSRRRGGAHSLDDALNAAFGR
jgi:hypothetical protein